MRLIDADEIKKIISKSVSEYSGEYTTDMINMWGLFTQLIDNAPTVTPDMAQVLAYECGKESNERPTGEWIYTNKEDKQKGYGGYCSVCKCDMPIGINDWKQEYYESKFCPNCGAKMKEV